MPATPRVGRLDSTALGSAAVAATVVAGLHLALAVQRRRVPGRRSPLWSLASDKSPPSIITPALLDNAMPSPPARSGSILRRLSVRGWTRPTAGAVYKSIHAVDGDRRIHGAAPCQRLSRSHADSPGLPATRPKGAHPGRDHRRDQHDRRSTPKACWSTSSTSPQPAGSARSPSAPSRSRRSSPPSARKGRAIWKPSRRRRWIAQEQGSRPKSNGSRSSAGTASAAYQPVPRRPTSRKVMEILDQVVLVVFGGCANLGAGAPRSARCWHCGDREQAGGRQDPQGAGGVPRRLEETLPTSWSQPLLFRMGRHRGTSSAGEDGELDDGAHGLLRQ